MNHPRDLMPLLNFKGNLYDVSAPAAESRAIRLRLFHLADDILIRLLLNK